MARSSRRWDLAGLSLAASCGPSALRDIYRLPLHLAFSLRARCRRRGIFAFTLARFRHARCLTHRTTHLPAPLPTSCRRQSLCLRRDARLAGNALWSVQPFFLSSLFFGATRLSPAWRHRRCRRLACAASPSYAQLWAPSFHAQHAAAMASGGLPGRLHRRPLAA